VGAAETRSQESGSRCQEARSRSEPELDPARRHWPLLTPAPWHLTPSTMDPERQRIQDDLRGLVAGDVRCDEVFLQLFASDASIYQLPPLAVVRPRNTADVAAIVKYAAE